MNTVSSYPKTYNISNTGINQQKLKASLAESKQAVNENIESNTMTKLLTGGAGQDSSKFDALLLIPIISFIDKTIDRFMGGSEEKSLLKKVANIGDKISDKLHLGRVLSEEKTSKIGNFIKNNRFTKYFTRDFQAVSKSPFAQRSALSETLSKELDSHAQELLASLTSAKLDRGLDQVVKGVTSLSDDTVKLIKNLGPLKKELTPDFAKSVISSLEEALPKLVNSGYQFSQADIKSISILEQGINQFLQNPASVPKSALSESIASVLSKYGPTVFNDRTLQFTNETLETFASVASKNNISTKQIVDALDDLAKNGIDSTVKTEKLSQLKNKLKAAKGQMGNTLLGKKLAQGTLKTKDIITYGGGLISLFFTATAITQAIKAAKEAPKGEKKSTFMHVISEQYLGFILFGPSIQMLYKAGGNKYRGMTVEAREALKNLIKNTNIDETITREGIKVAKLQRDLLLKGVDKDKVAQLAGKGIKEAKNIAKSLKGEGAKLKLWERPLKFMGRVLDMGLDKIQKPTFIKLGTKQIKLPKPTLKGFVGGLGRALIIMMVIQPFIQKPITKLCHKIFGEPKTYLKKQQEASNAKNTTKQAISPSNIVNEQAQPTEHVIPVNNNSQPQQQRKQNVPNNSETNLIKRWTQVPSAAAPVQKKEAVTSQNEPVPALNIFKKTDKKAEKRYIPSTEPVVVKDNEAEIIAQVEPTLRRSQKLMQEAQKLLN